MEICFYLSAGVFAIAVITAAALCFVRYKRGRILSPANVMFVCTFVSAFILSLPLFGDAFGTAETVLLSLHNTIRMFAADSDFELVTNATGELAGYLPRAYSLLASVLYVMSPLMTFGFILSFFRGVSCYRRYICGFFKKAYVFSELNERSLCLAESVFESESKSLLVFTNVSDEQKELAERAKELNAICFPKDILSVNLDIHSSNKQILLFAISDDETENRSVALSLLDSFGEREHTDLYAFCTGSESELLLGSAEKGRVKFRRVDEVRSLVYRTLCDSGKTLFDSAKDGHISVLIVGLSRFGSELAKALAWYCRIPGYTTEINIIDSDESAFSRFAASCPELISVSCGGTKREEDDLAINFIAAAEAGTVSFASAVTALSGTTAAFVSPGDDGQNVESAVTLRVLFERMRIKSVIYAFVRDGSVYDTLAGAHLNGKDKYPYEISCICDIQSSYSVDVIINSELEHIALLKHCKWGSSEDSFWSYEYNYRSSMASAVHGILRKQLGLKGSGKSEEQLTTEERDYIERLEHARWNAYMRSEGFIYSGSTDPASRNDLGKMHNDLVPFEALTEEEKRKDSSVGSV